MILPFGLILRSIAKQCVSKDEGGRGAATEASRPAPCFEEHSSACVLVALHVHYRAAMLLGMRPGKAPARAVS